MMCLGQSPSSPAPDLSSNHGNKPRRHPGLDFEKYQDALCKSSVEVADEAKRNASEGFQGLPKWIEFRTILEFCCQMPCASCLQDIAFGSTAFASGINTSLRCRFTFFRL